ncbi:hypothetical protein EW146_g8775 [Bondarzewia mesenterica]|uniref:Uncharacterized protein n=1 Tax=Bondarzewia mesenterica TaxID=1095465 RepID=A0A4S4LBQ6_9AGAM|nr:hypothetical protein EW146_g8775 [Bondarzewia mesenterica]
MTSPSKPVNITSPRIPLRGGLDSTPSGSPFTGAAATPDLRALRAQYAGTPPPPNIPPRLSVSNNPAVPSSGTLTPRASEPLPLGGTASETRSVAVGGISARRPAGLGVSVSGTPGGGSDGNPVDIDDLADEEKAKILRRHLVSREERGGGARPGTNGSEEGMSRKSSVGEFRLRRKDTEAFPVPYHAPGADVT